MSRDISSSARNFRRGIGLLALTLALSACVLGPDFTRPASSPSAAYTKRAVDLPSAGPADARQRLVAGNRVARDWWRLFGSPSLNDTIALALSGSPTLETARATLAAAEEAIVEANAAFYPQLDLGASASRQRAGGSTGRSGSASHLVSNLFSIGPTVSYGPDIFGRNRRFAEQQSALAQFQAYELAAAYLTLTGNTVTQALNIAGDAAQIKAIEQIVASDRQNLALVQLEKDAGKAAQADVLAAETQLLSDQALLPPVRQQLSAAQHALSLLVGKSPGEWSPPFFDLDAIAVPRDLPLQLPSALLRARPDILAAEAQLHAATAAVGVTEAQLYPSLTLTGSFTQQAATTGPLFEGANSLWSAAASLTAPIFHGGQLEAQHRAALDQLAAQVGTYRQTVLTAFGQVADTLRALEHDAELLAAEQRAMIVAAQSLGLTQEAYRAGTGSLLQVLDAQRLAAEAQLAYVRAKGQRDQDTAQLFEAMGGAWRQWNDPALGIVMTGSR